MMAPSSFLSGEERHMNIEVRMFMEFRSYLPPDATGGRATIPLEEGATVEKLLNLLGITLDKPKITVINGVSMGLSNAAHSTVLHEGDIVSLFSPVGGG